MKDGLFSDALVTWKWKARHRSWQGEAEIWMCSTAEVLLDPLMTLKKRSGTEEKSESKQFELPEFADPLGLFLPLLHIFNYTVTTLGVRSTYGFLVVLQANYLIKCSFSVCNLLH